MVLEICCVCLWFPWCLLINPIFNNNINIEDEIYLPVSCRERKK